MAAQKELCLLRCLDTGQKAKATRGKWHPRNGRELSDILTQVRKLPMLTAKHILSEWHSTLQRDSRLTHWACDSSRIPGHTNDGSRYD